ncbi:hypothetical protein LINPERHAP1_LOCUS17862 [Linum perenne]
MLVNQETNPRCPRIAFTDEEVINFCKPWSRALVVKVLEKSFSFLAMKRRLEFLWARSGPIQVSDLDNRLFLVRFAQEKDYRVAAFGGPWKIYDFYIAVAQWSPSFNEEDPFKSILTWVRLPKLPIQYFNQVAVERIGNYIGKTVRLDLATTEGARGRYARVCVEVDISKPLLGKYMIGDRVLKIEYESLENMCFDCGFYGHKKEGCLAKVLTQITNQDLQMPDRAEDIAEEHDTGEWMTVQRRNRRKPTKGDNQKRKPESSKAQMQEPQQGEQPGPDHIRRVAPAETSETHPKQGNVYAEALRKVLDKAAIPTSTTAEPQQKAPVLKTRPALLEITNMPVDPNPKVMPTPVADRVTVAPQDTVILPELVDVPVIYQNPTFQAAVPQPKPQKAMAKVVKRVVNKKGKEVDPFSFLNGKKTRLVKKNPKLPEKADGIQIHPDENASCANETRKPPDCL